MKDKYKLIAIDLDGTLLKDNKTISDKNKKAIKECLKKNIKIVISSGRSIENIKDYAIELGIEDGYCSAFHGSSIFRTRDIAIMNETFLKKDIANKIIKEIESIDNIGVLVFTKENIYTNNINEYIKEYLENKILHIKEINLQNINEDITKILLKGDREHLEQIKFDLQYLNSESKILFSELDLLEFMSLKTNKGFSLEYISNIYGINIEETIAIGDNYNDIEMIEKAGLGVAVNNAVEDLKNRADYITINSNNEDAIEEVINKFIFEI